VLIYWAFCAAFGALSLLTESRLSKLIMFTILIAAVGGVLWVLSRKKSAG
jgi:hypothetical protein